MIKASVVGATGYTGAVLTDILARHPHVELAALTSTSYAGAAVDRVFPALRIKGVYTPYQLSQVAGSDVAFVCYPHGESHPVVAELVDAGVRVIDLSADFRLRDVALYPDWYGFDHPRADLVNAAVYGLPELYRDDIRDARVVANPGCYPTSILLGVMPLTVEHWLELVVADSKSGVSGAGKQPTDKTHFCQVQDNFRAYSELGHRHTAEMAEELSILCGADVPLSFTPHLLPVDRGILSTVYVRLGMQENNGLPPTTEELLDLYRAAYASEPFVEVVSASPSLREVQGTNYCRMTVMVDVASGLIKVISVIDNLVKGASGQAVQNMNIMFGLPETAGLEAQA